MPNVIGDVDIANFTIGENTILFKKTLETPLSNNTLFFSVLMLNTQHSRTCHHQTIISKSRC